MRAPEVDFLLRTLGLVASCALLSGCAGLVNNAAADALSGTGGVFARDDDPELIEHAAPFGLKTMEAVLIDTPEHQGLLLSLVSGYAQYGAGFVAEEAHRVREEDYDRAEALEARAAKLYRRALGYGLRALEARHDGFERSLRESPAELEERLQVEDVPYLYWTSAAWSLSIGASGLDPEAIADFPLAERLARWALDLDPDWDDGSLHTLLLSIEANKPGGDLDEARSHFLRALALDGGRRAGTFVTMAENVAVQTQDVVRFHDLLKAALAIDVDAYPEDRLANVIMQRRARRLLEREEDLFLETYEEVTSSSSGTSSGSEP